MSRNIAVPLMGVCGLVMIMSYQNCARRPGVTNGSSASASYDHAGVTGSCANCHGAGKVFDPYKRVAGLPAHSPTNGQDCSVCHMPGNSMSDWKKGVASHSPMPVSCNSCHQKDRPTQAHYLAKDCFACHSFGSGAFLFDHKDAARVSVGFCLPCHDSIGRPKHQAAHPEYFTANGGDGSCQTCHAPGSVVADWRNAAEPHVPMPTSCNSCHAGDRPATTTFPDGQGVKSPHYTSKDCNACHVANSTGFTFGHTLSNNANINFCLPCHDARGRSKHGNHPEYFVGDGTCYSCHTRKRSFSD